MTCAVASFDSKWIATASSDGTIIVWDAQCGTITQQWLAHRGHIHTLTFSPNGRRLASSSSTQDERFIVWEVTDSSVVSVAMPEGPTEAVATSAWSPDGMLIASACSNGTVCVWDAQTLQSRDQVHHTPSGGGPKDLQFSPDARYLAWIPGSLYPYFCVIWKPLTGEQPMKLYQPWDVRGRFGPETIIKAFSFDPKSRRIVTVHRLLGSTEGKPSYDIAGPVPRAHDRYNTAQVWDITTGTLLSILGGHKGRLCGASFSTDGSVLSAACDGSANIRDAESFKVMASLKGSRERDSERVCFFRDGMYITEGRKLRLWQRMDNGVWVTKLADQPNLLGMTQLTCSPDGSVVVCGNTDGMVYFQSAASFTAIEN